MRAVWSVSGVQTIRRGPGLGFACCGEECGVEISPGWDPLGRDSGRVYLRGYGLV